MGGVADAQQAGPLPPPQPVDPDFEQLDVLQSLISVTRSPSAGTIAAMLARNAASPVACTAG